jgi:SP family galactose:H+ symporter-like MFS transporter
LDLVSTQKKVHGLVSLGFYFFYKQSSNFCLEIIASIMVLGSLSGALCGGLQGGRFGRKRSMMIDSVVFIVGILLSALAPNFYVIVIARLVLGHSAASAMVSVPIYVSETSQPKVREITGVFTVMCYTSGFALALIFGKFDFVQ